MNQLYIVYGWLMLFICFPLSLWVLLFSGFGLLHGKNLDIDWLYFFRNYYGSTIGALIITSYASDAIN